MFKLTFHPKPYPNFYLKRPYEVANSICVVIQGQKDSQDSVTSYIHSHSSKGYPAEASGE